MCEDFQKEEQTATCNPPPQEIRTMTCSFPPPERGLSPCRGPLSTVAQFLLLFSALNPRRTKAESISTRAYLLLLPCVTLSESVTHWKPGSPQLSPTPASFFFCKKQQEKENRWESYPHCAFLLTATVPAHQATASCLLFPVQTVKEIKPELWCRGNFRPGHENTGPDWKEEMRPYLSTSTWWLLWISSSICVVKGLY